MPIVDDISVVRARARGDLTRRVLAEPGDTSAWPMSPSPAAGPVPLSTPTTEGFANAIGFRDGSHVGATDETMRSLGL